MSNKPIRVAQVLAGAERGGAENFFVRLVSGLNERPELAQKAFIRNHAHRVQSLRHNGVETEGFSFGGPLDVIGKSAYRRALKNYRPDIVMTWMGRASITTKSSPDYLLVNRLGHYYNLKYYRHADYWIGISKGICQHMVDGGLPKERIFHIPNFADETPVEPLARDSFDTPADRPLILAAGRLHINKGFDVLLHALTQIPDAMLWLAGSGPEEAKLKALCHKLGLDTRVRFLGWRTDVTALMRTADLFVCPSRHEGLGSIVMESWAHRCPIVATKSQGPGEVITDGLSGLLTPIDDADALAAAIKSVLENPGLREQLVESAAEVYAKGYSKQHIVAAYTELYQHLLEKGR
ncbi:glycosyltransferase [Microbulbifer thermotolerans]|uniref:Glycosyl transferase n=1 Tax=Microbulbifer thermotolerans TaxID=252514 RepID=A0A143HP54_MICTH|nr:glycosyltransferase [Microbulbifer thermotolerans]AMX03514.1 glycosyl transferase [Microbulbifer thermotolerans]MCX2781085.1 glycosyltransferase [Microbulbifer thermotolerans]MCX2782230.1 glycosyltransferase [Microbulbifer thermotolerans]MCX2795322.1 glycosyltransferase [Microbulbifer thermotolerans]MCX2801116.1 glycosyltransferase [Microbulbifer thermotolerans]